MREKKLKVITIALAVFTISLVAFKGVYVQKYNKMENIIKEYSFSSNLSGYRELVFEISDSTEVLDNNGNYIGNTDKITDENIESNSYQKTDKKVNSEESKNEENYKITKDIIEKRIKKLGVTEYSFSFDKENGKMYLLLPEDKDTDHTVSNILQVSDFKIRDAKDSSKIFVTNDQLKKVATVYNTTEKGTTVFLQIELNEKGKETLKEISVGEYATPKKETENKSSEDKNAVEAEGNVSSEENTENKETSKEAETEDKNEIVLEIDGNTMVQTSFADPIENGIINLSMNQETTDTKSINEALQSASTIAILLNTGKLPLTYKVSENQYIIPNEVSENIKFMYKIILIITGIAVGLLIISFKVNGIIASIAYIGYIAVYCLLIRYTNLVVSPESITAMALLLILNYGLVKRIVQKNEKEKDLRKIVYANEFKSTILKLIPIYIISIIFSFIKWTSISTFGMFMFWGLTLSIIYNYYITKNILN